jgi:Rrf2 family transcriptional regulator, cysteine metabolism repressor
MVSVVLFWRSDMKLLTKNTDYAVRALLELSRSKDDFLSSKEISFKQKIPYQFLRRILNKLIENKLAVSKEGGHGGFKIAAVPDSISVYDIIMIFQGDVMVSECMFRKKICHNRSKCALRKELLRIENILNGEFKNLTIEKLLESTGGNK